MYGPGFEPARRRRVLAASEVDPSFVYRIDVASHAVDQVVPVGSVPKYVATTPDGKLRPGEQLVHLRPERHRLRVRARGAAAAHGGLPPGDRRLARLGPGLRGHHGRAPRSRRRPRHLRPGARRGRGRQAPPPGHQPRRRLPLRHAQQGRTVAKVDAATGRGGRHRGDRLAPRSMDIVGRRPVAVRRQLRVVDRLEGHDGRHGRGAGAPHGVHPIGITYDRSTSRVWVACYGGEIEIFDDALPAP